MTDEITQTELIQQAAELFRNASYPVAFTGAGISTDSGIPDFRSPSSGLWKEVDPMAVASIYGFKRDPQAFYNWVRPLAQLSIAAQPNPGHDALVALEKMDYLRHIITQNIDMLHTRAGSGNVHEIHGHMRTATCIHCFTEYDGEAILEQFLAEGAVPRCTNCREGVLKPNVILFGEQLPVRALQAAKDAARQSDLMIVIGSSLEVAPANELPDLARRTGANLIVVNITPTMMDDQADVVIHDRAAEVLPEIVRYLEKIR